MSQRRERPRVREVSPLLISLAVQLFQQFERLENKPPVTIILLGCNILPYILETEIFGYNLSDVQGNCLNPRIISRALWNPYHPTLLINRIILPGFMHANDIHLYYNMLSLSWKGINLERTLGSYEFLQLVIFSLICSHCLMVIIASVLNDIGISSSLTGYDSCAIGFSAVLFSLKYVWNNLSPEMTNIMGINVPSKYAAWIELVMISLVTPNASFLGHLCGILAGILYIHGLKRFILHYQTFYGGTNSNNRSQRYTYASGTSGRRSDYYSRDHNTNERYR